jgi:hypothetical protein
MTRRGAAVAGLPVFGVPGGSIEDEKEVVRVLVRVPDKLTLDLDDHEVVPVELANGSWVPMLDPTWRVIWLTRRSANQSRDEFNEQVILEQFARYMTPLRIPCGFRIATRRHGCALGIAVPGAIVLGDASLALRHLMDIESPETINRRPIQAEFTSLLIPAAVLEQPCSGIRRLEDFVA